MTPMRRSLGGMVSFLLALTLVAASDATAQTTPSGGEDGEGSPVVLDDVVVTSEGYALALAELNEARAILDTAEAAIRHGQFVIPDLLVAVDRMASAIPRLTSQLESTRDISENARADLDTMAAVRYLLEVSAPDGLEVFDDPTSYQDTRRRAVLLGAAAEHRRRTLVAARQIGDDAEHQLSAATSGIVLVRALLEQRRTELGLAVADAEAVGGDLDELEHIMSVERRLGTVGGSDLTFVALEAYVTAAARTAVEDPSCGLDWALLAGVGRVESRHGTFGDSSLDVAGQTGEDIIGIALDGTRNTREIRDTDGGRLDGDPVYDRAVGPMQFIPTTWVRWARDGDGDGRADPHNLYDAATAAGAYLCAGGEVLSSDGARRAVFSYNRSERYVDVVLELADDYRRLDITVQ